MGRGELAVNLPLGFEEDQEHNELHRRIFGHLKKEVLGGRKISKILHNEARREHLLNKILGTTDLPYDWTKQLVKKSDLDSEKSRANNLQSWKDNHFCSCPHSDYDTLKSENQTLKTENTQLKEHKCDSN